MGQVLGVCCLLCYEHCNIPDVIDDLSLFPPSPPFCYFFYYFVIVDFVNRDGDKILAYYNPMGTIVQFPESVTFKELNVVKDTTVVLAHYKSASSRF